MILSFGSIYYSSSVYMKSLIVSFSADWPHYDQHCECPLTTGPGRRQPHGWGQVLALPSPDCLPTLGLQHPAPLDTQRPVSPTTQAAGLTHRYVYVLSGHDGVVQYILTLTQHSSGYDRWRLLLGYSQTLKSIFFLDKSDAIS